MEVQREEAIKAAEAKLRETLNEEFNARLEDALDTAAEQAEEATKAKLLKKQEALEELKRDITAQMQRLADERNELQERVSDSEQMMRRLEDVKETELQRMARDFQAER
jgi:uncharacterized protein YdcH (DUF465 family)